MNDPSLARQAFELMSTRPAGLISDIDGTLSRIATDPTRAVVDPQIKSSLHQLVGYFDAVAVVTGRAARDAARLVDIDGVLHVGNHGMERLEDGVVKASGAALEFVLPVRRVMDEARAKIAEPLVIFENKGVSGSIHYRNAPDPAQAYRSILAVLEPLAEREGLRLTLGRMVVEVRPPIETNKGTALIDIARERALRSIIFMGDDVTDVDAIRALSRLRDNGVVIGMSIGVVGPETPDVIAAESDQLINGIDGVSEFLAELVGLLAQRPNRSG